MNANCVVGYLEENSFIGASVIDTDETVHLVHGQIRVVNPDETERVLPICDFLAQYSGSLFRKIEPVEAAL